MSISGIKTSALALMTSLTFRWGRVQGVQHGGELLGEAPQEEVAVEGVVHVVRRAATPACDVAVDENLIDRQQ